MPHFLWQRQGPHEVGEIVGRDVKMGPHHVVAELAV